MNIENIVGKIPNRGSNGRRKASDVKYAIVHHDAVYAPPAYSPIARYISEANYHVSNPAKFGKRLAYTFKISAYGQVYQCSPIEEMCYHAGNFLYNKNSIGICLDGDFTRQQVPPAQMKALRDLLDWLCTQRPDMPYLVRSTVKCHSEVRLFPTACPGPALKEFVKSYRLIK